MKRVDAYISQSMSEDFFRPIRTKIDQAQFILQALKFFMNREELSKESNYFAQMTLSSSRMNRLTVVRPNKIFSMAFPFHFELMGENVVFKSKSIGIIDSISISSALTVISDNDLISQDCISNLADLVLDISINKPNLWGFIQELLMCEDGYVRFDRDEINAKGHIHPLDHLDIFYSRSATFKLGLKSSIGHDILMDILDTDTACHYINYPE